MATRATKQSASDRPRPPRIAPIADVTREPVDPSDLRTHSNLELVEITGDLSGVDLEGLGLSESHLSDVSARDLRMRSASFVDTTLERVDTPVLGAASVSFRDVVVRDSRLGSAELYDATWQSVHFTGCRLGYLNLRSARITDLLFTDCTIDELDLSSATVARMAFRDTSVRALTLHGARLTDTDLRTLDPGRIDGIEGLRGASLSLDQVQALAPAFAQALGIHVAG
jgi:uncharacterized protein YjbI with pentapeptide repeats